MEFSTSIAENVLGKLASYASQEISSAWGAQSELRKLHKTLLAIKIVLQAAENKQMKNPQITYWLGNLKDVCHDVDDVLDELEFLKLRKKVQFNNSGRINGQVRQFFSRWNPVVFNFRMGHKVKEVRERLVEIDFEKNEFSLLEVAGVVENSRVPQVMQEDRRMTTSKIEASNVIGRDDDRKQIITHLFNDIDRSREENVSVITIIGLGGLGKTTLAKLVYNDSKVDENFEMKMWICVSDNFDIQTLVRSISNAADVLKCENESLDCMEIKLKDTLRGKKFMLVLDDVWDTGSIGVTMEKWIDLKMLLDVGAKGSKIIITTRIKSVALLANSLYMHSLEGLSHGDCMSLFIKRAFNRGEEQHYQHLIKIGEDIVKKCGGVPLAVAALGSMLYLERDRDYWLRVRDDDMWNMGKDNILAALKLSYDALPPHLKPCFAFCSLFPKDFLFNSESLVLMWRAQGYIQTSEKHVDFEEMGVDYVRQLCSRSLFHIEGDLKTFMFFKVHDLVHDLAISVAKIECSTVNSRPSSEFEKVRHVSISKLDLSEEEVQVPNFMLKSKKLRTILFPHQDCLIISQYFLKTCFSRFKYMRVLDLCGLSLEELPSSISSLCHLRFLDLSYNLKLKCLPNSICKLLNLQSLDLERCDALEEIPKDIGNLINLRNLVITTQQAHLPNGLRCLTELRLFGLQGCVKLTSLGEEIQYLTNLRKLYIDGCENLESLPSNMKHLTAFHTLFIFNCEKLDLMNTEEGPQHLRSFYISESKLEVLPHWLEDCSESLQSIGLEKCVSLAELPGLQKFRFLEHLQIRDCSKLLALPEDLHCLAVLKELKIHGCPELTKNCKRLLKNVAWSEMACHANITLDSDADTDDDEPDQECAL